MESKFIVFVIKYGFSETFIIWPPIKGKYKDIDKLNNYNYKSTPIGSFFAHVYSRINT